MFLRLFGTWRPLLLWWGLVVVTEMQNVSGIEVKTQRELVAVNGTNVKLSCTFTSTHPVSRDKVRVMWDYRPLNSQKEITVFYHKGVSTPPEEGPFKNRVVWSGDIEKRDASITLQEVSPIFNGTYICKVNNDPDVHGTHGETVLKVVNKVSLSEISLLGAVVGGSCVVIMLILGIVMAVRLRKKRKKERGIEPQPGETDMELYSGEEETNAW